ncbi:DUF779 domain-containing protein [Streptomyces sp. NPDC047081]|uniref:DUF779 domain-containing protein n=1 Tax=Streptomyces sp. NPDC047081 TaxID=3154706 RepID=UPI0033FE96FC
MPENGTVGRVTATRAARRAITALCASHGGPVMFVQSGGCCDGSDPMCFPGGGFSLAAGDGLHFVTRVRATRKQTSRGEER